MTHMYSLLTWFSYVYIPVHLIIKVLNYGTTFQWIYEPSTTKILSIVVYNCISSKNYIETFDYCLNVLWYKVLRLY